MNKKRIFIGGLSILGVTALLFFMVVYGRNAEVFNSAGPIARQQRDLILFSSALMLLVIVPVFALTFGIAWRYRESNTKAKYSPELEGNRVAEAVWWGIPLVLIGVLSVVTWLATYRLDPYRPLSSNTRPVKVQVVALDWKWLFIYPEERVASVNLLHVPVGTPVNFEITSDAPMNSFWIPQLGGQIYAMAGMSTKLHLQADKPGTYRGLSANISGDGFSGMTFRTVATDVNGYQTWLANAQSSADALNRSSYDELAKPSHNNAESVLRLESPQLYADIIGKYMHSHTMADGSVMDGATHMESGGSH